MENFYRQKHLKTKKIFYKICRTWKIADFSDKKKYKLWIIKLYITQDKKEKKWIKMLSCMGWKSINGDLNMNWERKHMLNKFIGETRGTRIFSKFHIILTKWFGQSHSRWKCFYHLTIPCVSCAQNENSVR